MHTDSYTYIIYEAITLVDYGIFPPHLDFFNQINLSYTINNNVFVIPQGKSKHICKSWSYLLLKSDYIYFKQNGVWITRVFIRSLEQLENDFNRRGLNSLSPVHFFPAFYGMEAWLFLGMSETQVAKMFVRVVVMIVREV